MSELVWYSVFAITTAIYSVFSLYYPAIKEAKFLGVRNNFTESPTLSLFVFFIINLLIAPIIFIVILVPKMQAEAYRGISKVIKEPEF